ncbi:MAG: DUF1737 domain-containing protein [Verrucomicrobiota bacterium]|jgi:uncharacterized protein DUF1737
MKIDEYKVLSAFLTEALQKMVNEHIKMGYQPFGSLGTVLIPEGRVIYCQPVVKYQLSN